MCISKNLELNCFGPTGLFLWDYINLPVVKLKSEVMQVVTEGLVALMKETSVSKESIYIIYKIFSSQHISECFNVFMNHLFDVPVIP